MNDHIDETPATDSDVSPTTSADDEVGYGRPPKATRFPPNTSGNPRGRPRGARGRRNIVEKIAHETHLIVESGKRRRVSTIELVLLSLRNRATENDLKAFRAFHAYLERYAPEQAQLKAGFLLVPGRPTTPEEQAALLKRVEEQQRPHREGTKH